MTNDVIRPLTIRPKMTVNEIILEMKKSGCFGAGRLAEATEIYEKMLNDDECCVFLGLSGAMTPSGMKGVISALLRANTIDAIVSTGANLVHDALEAFGGHHIKGKCQVDDRELHKTGIYRIYDVFVPEWNYVKWFDLPVLKFYKEIQNMPKITTPELFRLLAEHLDQVVSDKSLLSESVIYNAYKADIPIFVPAITDSCFGIISWGVDKWEQDFIEAGCSREEVDALRGAHPKIDVYQDLKEFFQIFEGSKNTAAVILGGGVPKNFIFQAGNELKKPLKYVIQITMDRPEPGGLSGATLEEAISWGKVAAENETHTTVISDITICFPLIAAAILERIELGKINIQNRITRRKML